MKHVWSGWMNARGTFSKQELCSCVITAVLTGGRTPGGSHTFFDHPHKLSLGHLVSRPEVYKFIKNLCKGFVLIYYYICVVVLVLQTCGLLHN